MRPRCLLLHVDRLPTISEAQEADPEEGAGHGDGPGSGLEDYMESIRELSLPPQPCYPLHGPLRGHRRWGGRATPCPAPRPAPQCPGAPLELSDVSFTVRDRASRCLNQQAMDRILAQAVFAGL